MNTSFIAKTAFQQAPAILACLTFASMAFAQYHPGYSDDSEQRTSNEFWMSYMLDTVELSKMSIPGTHDTMAYQCPNCGGLINSVRTQRMDLETQLKSGVRMLDIRCRNIGSNFAIHHNNYFLGAYFDDVLRTVTNFLKTHPGESVLMRVKEEYAEYNATRTFADRFRTFFVGSDFGQFFWKPGNSLRPTNPTLKEIRGKIVVLQQEPDYQGTEGWIRFGIPWSDLNIQDEYNVFSLPTKWGQVETQLNAASSGDREKIYINFLSGSTGFYPYEVAQFTNPRTSDWLSPNEYNRKRVGIIPADFPGPELIDRIIKQNSMYTTYITLRKGQLPLPGGGFTQCLSRPTTGKDDVVLARNGWQLLQWQSDGNLVLYDAKGPRWATGTGSNTPTATDLCWQSDGNLVIYDPTKPGGVAFATNTGGVFPNFFSGENLVLNFDCNLVINGWSIYGNVLTPRWSAGTSPCTR